MRNAIATLPPREQRVIALYYYNEVTMKDIGAELGVNESRVSQLHAQSDPAAARSARRGSHAGGRIGRLARRDCAHSKPSRKMAKASLPESDTRVSQAAQKRAGLVLVEGRKPRRSGQRVASGAQQVAQPERLGEPAAAGFFEEAFGIGAGDIAGHEDDAPRERRRRRRHRAVELHAVNARHLEIADDQVVTGFGEAGQSLLTVAGPIDGEAGIDQRLGYRDRQRGLIFHHQHTQSLERLERDRLLRRSRGRRIQVLTRDRQLDEERRALAFLRRQPDAAAVFLHDRVGDGEAEPGALADFLRREERIEHLALTLLRNARAIVIDFEHERSAIGVVRGANDDRAAAVGADAGLLGVDQEIEQDLLDLMAVGKDFRKAGGQRFDDLMLETCCS